MDVSRKTHEDIKSYLVYAIDNLDTEFELIVKNINKRINEKTFKEIFQYLRSKKFTLESPVDNESLTIQVKSNRALERYRTTLLGKSRIHHYCQTNKLQIQPIGEGEDDSKIDTNDADNLNDKSIIFELKTFLRDKRPIAIDDYGLRANLKQESELKDEPDDNKLKRKIMSSIQSRSAKYYRSRKRFSFLSASKLFKVDLTLVKSSDVNSQTLFQSGILNKDAFYEVEIELNGEYLKSLTADAKKKLKGNDGLLNVLKELFKITGNILRILQGNRHLMSVSETENVMKGYLSILAPSKKDIKNPDPRKYFTAPKLVSFKRGNLLPPEEGRVSVLEGYTVTDKADGERHLMYIHRDNKVYLINSRMRIKYTGLKHTDAYTILDGELITQDRNGNSINHFMVFDIYYYKKEMVAGLPLMEMKGTKTGSRYAFMKSVAKNKEKKFIGVGGKGNELKVQLKEFIRGGVGGADAGEIFRGCKKILDNDEQGNYPYHIDGLIFTPANLAVGAKYEGDDVKLTDTWNRVLKWKPLDELTIDFLVVKKGEVYADDENDIQRKYMLCELFVGYNLSKDIDPVSILKGEYEENVSAQKKFATCYLPITVDDSGSGNRIYATTPKEEITDNMIVEFAYDYEAEHDKEELKWIPYRIRHDRTEQYIATGMKTISGIANFITTADDVVDSIRNPVSREVIMGLETLDKDVLLRELNESSAYYKRDTERYASVIKPMRDFHTHWVKKYLYERFAGSERLFEIAVGQGGDMSRWLTNDYRMIVGIDIDKGGFYDKDNGIYKRYIDGVRGKRGVQINPNKTKMLFILMDASQLWNSKYIQKIEDELSRDFALTVFGMTRKSDIKEPSLLPFYRVASSDNAKFNVVSCMFAIHYMFETDKTLNNFVENVNMIIRKGGYFMGTTLDGYLVDKAFKDKGTTQLNATIKNQLGWAIEKQYDKYDDKNPERNIGKKINVFIESIGQWLPEYLVDYELLTKRLGRYNIEPVSDPKELEKLGMTESSGSFGELYEKFTIDMQKQDRDITRELKGFTEDMKEYSFLNRWFVFKKN